MSGNIKELMDTGRPQKQAVAIAYSNARKTDGGKVGVAKSKSKIGLTHFPGVLENNTLVSPAAIAGRGQVAQAESAVKDPKHLPGFGRVVADSAEQ